MGANAYPQTNIKQVNIAQLIEYCIRESGAVLAEQQTPQYVEAARLALQLTLQELSDKSELLWLYKEVLIGTNAGQREIFLPPGTIDVIEINSRYNVAITPAQALPADNSSAANAFSRTLNNVATTTFLENYIGADFGSNAIRPTYFGFNAFTNTLPSITYANLLLEYSDDGVNWILQQSLPSTTLSDYEWQYYQLEGSGAVHRYWRLRLNSSSTFFAIRQIVFGTDTSYDIPLYRFNKDEYFNLPQRQITGQRSLQYWFDRQAQQPIVKLWPAPLDDWQVIFALLEAQMPDVQTLGTTLNVPNRWLLAIQTRLSAKLSLQLPNVTPDRIQFLHLTADNAYAHASSEERDKSPLYFRPQIRVYTR